jgi:hypothetical protein
MKIRIVYSIILGLGLLFMSCGHQAPKVTEPEVLPADPAIDTIGVKYEGPPPIVEEPKSDSPFFEVGCCKEEEKRMEDCCCLKVLEQYAKLKKEKSITFIAKLKMNDVILSNCYSHNRYSEKFEAIDYPEEE